MMRIALIVFSLVCAPLAFEPDSKELRSRGRSLYVSLCQRCHGESGDAADYPGITPLSGITLRFHEPEIAGLSAPFVGRTFKGKEAEALVAYLRTLKGEKGFEQPGYLFSPYLLEKKLGETGRYRVVDARPLGEYQARHIPNAVSWPASEQVSNALARASTLGAGAETFVVVYDANGGPEAAAVWWQLFAAGHKRVAVLDGGLARWTSQNYPQSTDPAAFSPVKYLAPSAEGLTAGSAMPGEITKKTLGLRGTAAAQVTFDWRKTRSEQGLLPAADVRAYLSSLGISPPGCYAIPGRNDHLGYLAFVLTLSGHSPAASSKHDLVCLAGADDDAK